MFEMMENALLVQMIGSRSIVLMLCWCCSMVSVVVVVLTDGAVEVLLQRQ